MLSVAPLFVLLPPEPKRSEQEKVLSDSIRVVEIVLVLRVNGAIRTVPIGQWTSGTAHVHPGGTLPFTCGMATTARLFTIFAAGVPWSVAG